MSSSSSPRNVEQILRSAQQMMDFARIGRDDFVAGGDRRLLGLYNAITSGRSVTFVLQNLKGKADGFDAWYEAKQDVLKVDPVCQWFKELRNFIEKQGTHGEHSTSMTFNLNPSNAHEMQRVQQNAPAGTKKTIFGDGLGRSKYVVELADGTEHDVFFDAPPSIVQSQLNITGAPGGRGVEELLEHYLSVLEDTVNDAVAEFGE